MSSFRKKVKKVYRKSNDNNSDSNNTWKCEFNTIIIKGDNNIINFSPST